MSKYIEASESSLFDKAERLEELHALGDPLARLDEVIDCSLFAPVFARIPKQEAPTAPAGAPASAPESKRLFSDAPIPFGMLQRANADVRLAIGAVPKPAEWRIAKSIFVADDEATAQRYAFGSDGPYHFYFKQLVRKLVGAGGRGNLFKTDPDMLNEAITPEYVTKRLVLAGTVDSVVAQLLAFREQVGDFGTLLYAGHDWVEPALAKRSMQLMAEEVMPRVNAAIGQ